MRVMAGLVPAIHVLLHGAFKLNYEACCVDGRVKPGHDGVMGV